MNGARRQFGSWRTAAACALAVAGLGAAGAAPASAARTCTWGGTPTAETGIFKIDPGLTNLPSSGPRRFTATGTLAGGRGCHGTMQFIGQLDTGATCPFSTFRGRVIGLPGVSRYLGYGSLDVPSRLYDSRGHLVGIENAQIATRQNFSNALQCNSPTGFTGPATFSSTVTVFGASRRR